MTTVRRISLPVSQPIADANIVPRYAIEASAWVWHPEVRVDEHAVLRFRNAFTLDAAATFRLHLSADQRYELFLDGQYVGMGPDRSDLLHWSFATYELQLAAGDHVLEATAWWLGGLAPTAQVSHRGGFICAVEDGPTQLNTGGPESGWTVARDTAWSFSRKPMRTYHVIGPAFTIRGGDHLAAVATPVVVREPVRGNRNGIVTPGWHLEPSPLPDMLRVPRQVGAVCAIRDDADDAPFAPDPTAHPDSAAWQALLHGKGTFTVPPGSTRQALIDLGDYYCGYVEAHLTGGTSATVSVEWAESLFEMDSEGQHTPHKGDRNAVAGKQFFGFGDTFQPDGQEQTFRSLWWRSGRYLLVTVRTDADPLTIQRLTLIETRYPLESEFTWRSDRPGLDAIRPLAVRGLQMCSHETYMDCPYYEQLMYVGDTRLEMLINHVMTGDDRLIRRGIELFDWSRWKTGFVAERYPSEPYQLSLTFSLIWVLMLRDYAWWRDDAGWVRERLVGVRSLLEHFAVLQGDDGTLGRLPGWSFIDWVPTWRQGCAPGVNEGASSILNLLYALALQSAADVERACGDSAMADRWHATGAAVTTRTMERFWHEPTGRLADDADHAHFSEHAQCLALLTGAARGPQRDAVVRSLLHDTDLARTTVYFSFYLFETLYHLGRGDTIVAKCGFWEDLLRQGFKTPVETPEPSRSDCHAWGSHPLYHMHASLAGVRPDAPGFRRIRIAPEPGPLRELDATIPHPRGTIRTSFRVGDTADIALPPDTPGVFVWRGRSHDLAPGATARLPMPDEEA